MNKIICKICKNKRATESYVTCDVCREKKRLYQEKRNKTLKFLGRCIVCRKEISYLSVTLCDECLEYRRAYRKRRFAQKKEG